MRYSTFYIIAAIAYICLMIAVTFIINHFGIVTFVIFQMD